MFTILRNFIDTYTAFLSQTVCILLFSQTFKNLLFYQITFRTANYFTRLNFLKIPSYLFLQNEHQRQANVLSYPIVHSATTFTALSNQFSC